MKNCLRVGEILYNEGSSGAPLVMPPLLYYTCYMDHIYIYINSSSHFLTFSPILYNFLCFFLSSMPVPILLRDFYACCLITFTLNPILEMFPQIGSKIASNSCTLSSILPPPYCYRDYVSFNSVFSDNLCVSNIKSVNFFQ